MSLITYPIDDFLSVVETSDGIITTTDVAVEIGCTHETARLKLNELEQDGEVTHQTVADTHIWMIA